MVDRVSASQPSPSGRGQSWQQAVEKTVSGLGYDLVDCERSSQGLLRVYIDRLPGQPYETGAGEFITVDDCEKVTRQLQYVLEVENCDYSRLEVSSPGLDRPLNRAADYLRFAGLEIDLTLKAAFQGRRKYRGVLEAAGDAWQIVFKEGEQLQALGFTLDEVREARLVPVVDFKRGKRRKNADAGNTGPDAAGAAADSQSEQHDGQDSGGREQ